MKMSRDVTNPAIEKLALNDHRLMLTRVERERAGNGGIVMEFH